MMMMTLTSALTQPLRNRLQSIPMNHSNRVSIAGAGIKNRYKTIIPSALLSPALPLAPALPYTIYTRTCADFVYRVCTET